MIKNIGKRKKRRKPKIFLKNFHPSIKTPFNKTEVAKIAKKVMGSEDCDYYNLEINLLSNAEIRGINRKFLNHDYYTDIITFPYSNGKSDIEAEMYISLDEVKKNSSLYGSTFKNEFMRVLIHGCLHLTGYNDKTKKQKELIRKKENFYLSKFGKRYS